MAQYRGVVKKHTSFILDLLKVLPDGSVYRYVSNFRSGPDHKLSERKA